ncbi:ABC transporter ATP-binding protein [Phreatobacter stygius]|uniref:ABC transporter ATP-binding protein n=1 Tax=Phreatobacter stygius TaxID=1940610 RepID=A0A4D7ASN7_9HYPH|nr:ABC transporter ATP-binding protein [Phreatobacter stygius]QCI63969.1 ABC transporter ATP-binding protein [Phreatobacter stygius]
MSHATSGPRAVAHPGPAPQGSIHIAGVSKHYGNTRVLSDVDLAIDSGTFLTLLGPSGCGKTTLLRLIAGFIEPSAGEIAIDGRDMAGLPPQRRPIGMVFQNLALFPHFSVEENIAYGLRLRKVGAEEMRRKVELFLDLVGLVGLGGRRISQLSGGQKQRVALARALVLEPSILLLDEPLSALDLQLRKQLQVSLKEIQKKLKTTFVFVTHDQEEATLMSDSVVVMSAGKVQQFGSPQTIYSRPENLFVAKFIGELNEIAGSVVSAGGGALDIDTAVGRLTLPAAIARGLVASAGSACLVCLRPEHIDVRREGEATPGRVALPSTVVDRIALGPVIRVAVRCGESRMTAVRLARDSQALPEVGAACIVEFDPADAQIFAPLAGEMATAFGEPE